MLGAVIVAAGSSRRMGFDKLAADLGGMPVLARTLLAFQNTPDITAITVAAREETRAWIEQLAEEHAVDKLVAIVSGGKERQDSVLAGLLALQKLDGGPDWAAVHDGARPLIRPETISRCFQEAQKYGSGCLAAPVTDTLKRADSEQTVLETVDRSSLWAMQTPQIFPTGALIAAYQQIVAAAQIVTDESAAMERAGCKVHLVANPHINAKITYRQDLKLAELFLQGETHYVP